ncbi:MAG: hypothetical protein K6D97_03770 [Clostridia bacterium]|nr:hypothetical protein [Clostridia bacterium]
MNQILDYTPNGSNRTNKNGGTKSDKVVRILAIFLMIFAVMLVGIAVYSRTVGNSKKKETPAEVTYTDAKISYEINEEENKVKVKVSHDKVIDKISYNWDTGKARDVDGNAKSEFEIDLDLSKGSHTLFINVTDTEGHITTDSKTFKSDNGKDIIIPNINISPEMIEGKAVVVITATDETEIEYITYRWNNDEEQKVTVDDVEENDERKKITVELEIFEGSNDLTIFARDKAGNQASIQKSLNGLLNPTGRIEISADRSTATVYLNHKNGISSVNVRVNDGEPQSLDMSGMDDEAKKDFNFDIDLNAYGSGDKNIRVEATSVDKTTGVFEATVEGEEQPTEPEQEVVEDNENIQVDFLFPNEGSTERDVNPCLVEVKLHYDNGIRDIELEIDDRPYDMHLNDNSNDMKFELNNFSPGGTYKVKITVKGLDDTQRTVTKTLAFSEQ